MKKYAFALYILSLSLFLVLAGALIKDHQGPLLGTTVLTPTMDGERMVSVNGPFH